MSQRSIIFHSLDSQQFRYIISFSSSSLIISVLKTPLRHPEKGCMHSFRGKPVYDESERSTFISYKILYNFRWVRWLWWVNNGLLWTWTLTWFDRTANCLSLFNINGDYSRNMSRYWLIEILVRGCWFCNVKLVFIFRGTVLKDYGTFWSNLVADVAQPENDLSYQQNWNRSHF